MMYIFNKKWVLLLLSSCYFFSTSVQSTTFVTMKTSLGDVKLALDEEKAPISVANFLRYAKEGFYNGTIFHRVINGFMVQGGGYNENMIKKPTHDAIKNEAANGLKNDRGTLAMARTNAPHSATAQFFINLVDNDYLNHISPSQNWGYAVFGKVVKGMEIIDKMAEVEITRKKGMANVPTIPIIIQAMEVEVKSPIQKKPEVPIKAIPNADIQIKAMPEIGISKVK